MKDHPDLSRRGARATTTWLASLHLLMFVTCVFWIFPACAQPAAWPVGILRPPGADIEAPVLSAVALSGDVAVTGYAGTATEGFKVYSRSQIAGTWALPQLLVQGQGAADGEVSLSADPQRLAVGSPFFSGAGRVSIYVRDPGPTGWILEQTLEAPAGAVQFGNTVSLRGDLLVVTASQNNRVYSYRFDAGQGSWSDAGFSFVNTFLGYVSAVTDGERIAYCRPLSVAGCRTTIFSDVDGWQPEAYPEPSVTSGRVLAVNSSWLFVHTNGNVAAYAHVGSEWQLRQEFPSLSGFSLSPDGTAILTSQGYSSRILKVGSGGLWESVSDQSLGAVSTAIDAGLALIGSQGFREDGVAWSASGDAAGIPDLTQSFFGGSVARVGDELWVGATGFDNSDQSAGSIWIYPSLGTGSHPLAPSLVPYQPAFQTYFGTGIVTDDSRVATYSFGDSGTSSGRGKVWIFDASSHQEVQQVELPTPTGRVQKLSLSISGDVLAVSRKIACPGSCESDLLIYRHDGSGYVLAQTITVPAGAPSGTYFASSTHVQGDWLLSGMLAFHSTAGGAYQYVGELSRPQGLAWHSHVAASGVASDGNQLAAGVAMNGSGIILVVYDFDNATGWTYSGVVKSGSLTVQNGCLRYAIRESLIVCTHASDLPSELYFAVPDPVGSDWTVVSSTPIPESARDANGYGEYQLLLTDDQVIIGTSDTGDEPAGTQIGQVTLMTLEEPIFASGFD